MEPSVICGSLKLARSIAEFAGLIETIGTKIDRLANAEFEAGFRALEQAAISSSEKDSLLREARYRFNKAISLEKEERLFLCHIGLAICHKGLSDQANFKMSLLQACKVKIQMSSSSGIPLVFDMIGSPVWGIASQILSTAISMPRFIRASNLKSEQEKIKVYLASIDT